VTRIFGHGQNNQHNFTSKGKRITFVLLKFVLYTIFGRFKNVLSTSFVNVSHVGVIFISFNAKYCRTLVVNCIASPKVESDRVLGKSCRKVERGSEKEKG
jgi:hypothetical protein